MFEDPRGCLKIERDHDNRWKSDRFRSAKLMVTGNSIPIAVGGGERVGQFGGPEGAKPPRNDGDEEYR